MTLFKEKEELVKILSVLWGETFDTPEITRKVTEEKLIVKFRFTVFKQPFSSISTAFAEQSKAWDLWI